MSTPVDLRAPQEIRRAAESSWWMRRHCYISSKLYQKSSPRLKVPMALFLCGVIVGFVL